MIAGVVCIWNSIDFFKSNFSACLISWKFSQYLSFLCFNSFFSFTNITLFLSHKRIRTQNRSHFYRDNSFSFPSTPVSHGTHRRVTLFFLLSSLNFFRHSQTNLALIVGKMNDLLAAWPSECCWFISSWSYYWFAHAKGYFWVAPLVFLCEAFPFLKLVAYFKLMLIPEMFIIQNKI